MDVKRQSRGVQKEWRGAHAEHESRQPSGMRAPLSSAWVAMVELAVIVGAGGRERQERREVTPVRAWKDDGLSFTICYAWLALYS
jgi:hypothetical protein